MEKGLTLRYPAKNGLYSSGAWRVLSSGIVHRELAGRMWNSILPLREVKTERWCKEKENSRTRCQNRMISERVRQECDE